jgi:hypothetical protein
MQNKKTHENKDGEPDDNDIAHEAAPSFLALANTFNEGNQFSGLDDMNNHMIQKIDERKKNFKIANYDDSCSNSESLKEATKTPIKKRKHQQIDLDDSDEEDS